jgi:hypothetical protein
MRTITLFGRLFDLNLHSHNVIRHILFSFNRNYARLQDMLANRGVGGIPVEGDVGRSIEGAIPQYGPALLVIVCP